MTRWFHIKEKNFDTLFDAFLNARHSDDDVRARVAEIIRETRAGGDAALVAQAKQFEGVDLSPETLRLAPDDIKKTAAEATPKIIAALDHAATRIEAWHQKQMPQNIRFTDEDGVDIQQRWSALDAVGIYIPGSAARYPSSLLMNAIPARIAGVKRIAATTPASGTHDPLLMAALLRADIDEVWQIGGAGAIAALAYGTETIAKVDKITGPGNAYVAAAKRQVFGDVGIDMIAGPSEILVIADSDNHPDWVAADLLSQAEHDQSAQSILITDNAEWAKKTAAAIDAQLPSLPREKIARESWTRYGAIMIVDHIEESADLANKIAAEHVQVLVKNPHPLVEKIRHAGTIFIGDHTPEVLGDYVIGTNHILPTAGAARFSSGLSVYDFMKRTSITHCPPASFEKLADSAQTLAEAEGLEAHARAAAIRRNI